MKAVFVAFSLFFCCAQAWAGNYKGVYVPYTFAGGLYLTPQAGLIFSNLPACATRNLLVLSVGPTDPTFSPQMTLLVSAYFAGRKVYILGAGTCDGQGDEIILQIMSR